MPLFKEMIEHFHMLFFQNAPFAFSMPFANINDRPSVMFHADVALDIEINKVQLNLSLCSGKSKVAEYGILTTAPLSHYLSTENSLTEPPVKSPHDLNVISALNNLEFDFRLGTQKLVAELLRQYPDAEILCPEEDYQTYLIYNGTKYHCFTNKQQEIEHTSFNNVFHILLNQLKEDSAIIFNQQTYTVLKVAPTRLVFKNSNSTVSIEKTGNVFRFSILPTFPQYIQFPLTLTFDSGLSVGLDFCFMQTSTENKYTLTNLPEIFSKTVLDDVSTSEFISAFEHSTKNANLALFVPNTHYPYFTLNDEDDYDYGISLNLMLLPIK